MKRSVCLFLLCIADACAFTSTQPAFLSTTRKNGKSNYHRHHRQQIKKQKKHHRYDHERSAVSPMMEAVAVDSANVLISQQSLEAEILSDLAHLCLDFATLFSPDTIVLRLFVICGRVFNILADYIPDRQMTTDEIVIQSFMLSLSCRNFFVMFQELLRSSGQPASFQDKRIYHAIFSPAGFTWGQYKLLVSIGALEWVHGAPDSTLCESRQNLLLTYRGTVLKLQPGKVYEVYGRRNGRCCHDYIGDLSLVKDLVDVSCGTRRAPRGKQVVLNQEQQGEFPHGTTFHSSDQPSEFQILQIGKTGAIILRINTHKLIESVKADATIAECTKNLIFNAIHAKLKHYDDSFAVNSSETNRTDDSSTLLFV
jgi:hypothetical protein